MREPDYLTRRQVLPILSASTALVATGVALAPAPVEPDAALKAAYARYQRKETEISALPAEMLDEEFMLYCDELSDLALEVHACPVETLQGAAIKARLAEMELDAHYCGHPDSVTALRAVVYAVRRSRAGWPDMARTSTLNKDWGLLFGSGPTYSGWAYRTPSPLGSNEHHLSLASAGLFHNAGDLASPEQRSLSLTADGSRSLQSHRVTLLRVRVLRAA